MTGLRLLLALTLAAFLAAAAIGCGFGLADDSGKPSPGQYWGWACPDGAAAHADAGCVAADASADAALTSDGARRD
jgi:hypothetical protein